MDERDVCNTGTVYTAISGDQEKMHQWNPHEILDLAPRAERLHSQISKGARRDILATVSDAGVVRGGIARIFAIVDQFLAFAWVGPASRALTRQSDLLSFLGVFSQRLALTETGGGKPIFPDAFTQTILEIKPLSHEPVIAALTQRVIEETAWGAGGPAPWIISYLASDYFDYIGKIAELFFSSRVGYTGDPLADYQGGKWDRAAWEKYRCHCEEATGKKSTEGGGFRFFVVIRERSFLWEVLRRRWMVQVFLADQAWQTVGEEPVDYGLQSNSDRASAVQLREVTGIKIGGLYFKKGLISTFSVETSRRIANITKLIDQGRMDEGARLALEMIHGQWGNFVSDIEPLAFGYLGRALLGAGKADQAVKACERAVLLDDEEPLWYLRLGECYKKLERFQEARASLYKGMSKLSLQSQKVRNVDCQLPGGRTLRKRFDALLREIE